MDFNLTTGTVPITNLQKLIVIAEADRLGLVNHDAYIETIKKLMTLFNISEKETLKEEKRMSIMNGVWHDAALDLPPAHEMVLAVKEKKNGDRDICLAYCMPEWEFTDPVTKEKTVAPYWVCSGNNNIIYWMPLPKMPGEENT